MSQVCSVTHFRFMYILYFLEYSTLSLRYSEVSSESQYMLEGEYILYFDV